MPKRIDGMPSFPVGPMIAQMITGSYLLPKDKRRKGDVGDDDDEGDIQEEEGEGVGYVFAKDYKFNIIHYVSEGSLIDRVA